MRERAQLWISASNREETMARVLSRAELNEGTVLHAHRSASSALIAVFENRGLVHTSDQCADLCGMLHAHDVTPPADVTKAADTLDRQAQKVNPETTTEPPWRSCDAAVAAASLDCVKRIRAFVNTALT